MKPLKNVMVLSIFLLMIFFMSGVSTVEAFYRGVTVVAKSGGNYADPMIAINAVKTWCRGGPSANNPCLIRIMPGIYNIGQHPFKMMSYLDIEGSGENTTIITGEASSPSETPSTGVVCGANNAEMRFLTVKAHNTVAIYNDNTSPKITNVTVSVTGSGMQGKLVGVYNSSSALPIMTNVTVFVSGSGFVENYGIYNTSSSPRMTNISISTLSETGSYNMGVFNNSSSPVMQNVSIIASNARHNWGIYSEGLSAPLISDVNVSASGGESSTGLYTDTSLPRMTNVTVSVSGTGDNTGIWNDNSSSVMMNIISSVVGVHSSAGSFNDGVYNESSSPLMTNVTASASGGGEDSGVSNFNSSPMMVNVFASASSAGRVDGIYNESSSPVMTNVTAIGKNGQNSVGMTNYNSGSGSYKILIDHSTFEGGTNSIDNDPGFILKIGASKLVGPANVLGTYHCVGSYNEGYTLLNFSCQ